MAGLVACGRTYGNGNARRGRWRGGRCRALKDKHAVAEASVQPLESPALVEQDSSAAVVAAEAAETPCASDFSVADSHP